MQLFLGFMAFLAISLWLGAIWFASFAVRILKRQDALYRSIAGRLGVLERALGEAVQKSDAIRESLAQISIPVNEPIAKYESVTLPDDANIRFVEKK